MEKKSKKGRRQALLADQKENRGNTRVISPGALSSRAGNLIDHHGVKKGFDFLHKNCNREINVMDIAAATGLSRRGLYKAFIKHIGASPGKILRRQRLETAKNLLHSSNYSLVEIAKISGFRNVNSFWVSFRNAEGIAPGEFRRESRFEDKRYSNCRI